MGNVHISLVGGQPAPIFNCIKATAPDEVVFIHSDSDDSIKSMNAVISEISIPYHKLQVSSTDPVEISSMAKALADKYCDDRVILNISGGLKSWTYIFGITFHSCKNADVVYMDQNNVLWNYRTMSGTLDFEFDMHTHFRLYGNSIDGNYIPFTEYTPRDDDALEKIQYIRGINYADFNTLVTVLTKDNDTILSQRDNGKFELKSGSYVEWFKASSERLPFVRICLYNRKKEPVEVSYESEHAIGLTFHSGWFEYKVAKMLSTWASAKEICLNCKFPFREGIEKNEADILVNTGSKVLFVECKTQITKGVDIDKFRSVIKTYGGTGSKGLCVTDAKMKDLPQQKCKEHGILTFSLNDNHLGLSERDALILLLESDLHNINTR